MVLVGKLMAEVGYPLNTSGSDALAGNFVKYAILISSPLGANLFKFEADLWTSVSLVCTRIDQGHQLVAGWRTRRVDTVPAKQHDQRQRDEGENGDRDGRAAGHSV
jgi:hypothetical protein